MGWCFRSDVGYALRRMNIADEEISALLDEAKSLTPLQGPM
jgi:hypothetical protein